MTDTNILALAQIIKAAGADPSDVVDAIWEAGYRQPERTAAEAGELTIASFHYCMSYSMPEEVWPQIYDDVLTNELMMAVLGDGESITVTDPVKVARAILEAGFSKEVEQ